MGRPLHPTSADVLYRVLNRANARRTLFEDDGDYAAAGPVVRPQPWLKWVNEPMSEVEVQRVRQSVNRNAPFGSEPWSVVTATRFGLEASLRPIGRPQKLVET